MVVMAEAVPESPNSRTIAMLENPRPSYARGTDWTPLELVADDAILIAGEKAA